MRRRVGLMLPLVLGIGSCGKEPVAPERMVVPDGAPLQAQNRPRGTGLSLDIVEAVGLPLALGGTITITEARIINFGAVETLVGGIVGVRVTGTLTGTAVDALGNLVTLNSEEFTGVLTVTDSGPGSCSIVTVQLRNVELDVLGLVNAAVPATVDAKGSGAVGSLLCTLGRLLNAVGGVVTGGVQGVVNAINRLI